MRNLRFVVAGLVVLLAGCESQPQLIGEWHAEQDGQTMSVVFAADSTFTMHTGTFTGEGTYEQADAELALRPTGALATVVPGGFTGSLVDWTNLSLCSTSGLCTNFEKVP